MTDQSTEFQINRLGHQGDGIADGPLFAPLTLPGEVVTGTAEGSQLKDVRVVTPSENRVKPGCRHFKACGGCGLQHAADAFVADWKVDVVRQALAAQGIVTEFKRHSPYSPDCGKLCMLRPETQAILNDHEPQYCHQHHSHVL